LETATELALYRMAQELVEQRCLSFSRRGSPTSISPLRQPLLVTDNGKGLTYLSARQNLRQAVISPAGLFERSEMIGAQLESSSKPRRQPGTIVVPVLSDDK
jgi:signal transduction histidine kinase